ncbi:DnaD domain protein [Virgibacillus sp. MSJ-26]|uniref:replication initiation and membrane attachment family protein n=1 Tax=Virgibacillus sp. MSJ-26 TaxID=2841522 RepID=UPI001C108DA1|nr:DnaD domain protein [Virgibacillus sp. MSJ-26]MBU5468082.1 DnaD domain protein [Virgibacillus sp. MSJ-26]
MNFIGKLLPIDGYTVYIDEELPTDYSISLTHLYQPLIGMQAVMLYYTLLHEVSFQKKSCIQTHHTLMNYMNMPLDDLYKARLKLEGIGLLNTYQENESKNQHYIYGLLSPFSPRNFFKDAMLSQLLFHHLGGEKYEHLRTHFAPPTFLKDSNDITVSFDEVFQTFEPAPVNVELIASSQKGTGPHVESIDFTWIEQMLKQRLIPVKRVLNKENKRVISQMMTLYDLTSYDIEKILLWSLNEENMLNIDEFKEACHNMFNSIQSNRKIKLSEKQKTMNLEKDNFQTPKTKEEMLIRELETISPKQLLADLSSGNQASEQDMRVIRDVMTSQGLPAPVMNVLIHYVLLQSNMKLSKAYIEKIASHWSRANLKTAKEAMEFAKKELNQFQNKPNQQRSYQRNRRANQKEVIPDWFQNRNKPKSDVIDEQSRIDEEKEKEELDLLLKQYKNDNNLYQG